MLSYDLDDGISTTLNASNGDLNTFYDTGTNNPFFRSLDANNNAVFWSLSDNSIVSQSRSGSTPTTIYTNQTNNLQEVAVYNDTLYWHSDDTDTIYKGSTDGLAAPVVVATGVTSIQDMVATADYIYYTRNTDNVWQVSTSGGAASVLFSTPNNFHTLRGIDVYNNMIYVGNYGINDFYTANLDGS
ncbi:MAG: hypothetical protein AAGA45_02040, partial [Verrucomicrobiota bacterium]